MYLEKLWPLICSSASNLGGKFCPSCHFLGAVGFMHIIAPPSHVLEMKFRITAGKLLDFVILWVGPGVPLDQSAFPELFGALVAVLESYRTWGFLWKIFFSSLED